MATNGRTVLIILDDFETCSSALARVAILSVGVLVVAVLFLVAVRSLDITAAAERVVRRAGPRVLL